MKIISLYLLALINLNDEIKTVSKNGMTVSWQFDDDQVMFEMIAPTDGWVAIGLNQSDGLTGTYLIMGRVKNGIAEVVEHHVFAPGDYRSFHSIDQTLNVKNITGYQDSGSTAISFSLPQKGPGKFAKHLYPDQKYFLLMAFSLDDDFQHHSTMRTGIYIEL